MFKSTRFVLIQEGMFLGFISCLLAGTIVPKFPIEAFLVFLGPLTIGAYGLKTLGHKFENGTTSGKIPK